MSWIGLALRLGVGAAAAGGAAVGLYLAGQQLMKDAEALNVQLQTAVQVQMGEQAMCVNGTAGHLSRAC